MLERFASNQFSRAVKGSDQQPLRQTESLPSLGFCRASRRAFSIARLDAEHPVPALSKPTFPGCKP
jgi:hypothetical protein